MSFQQLFQIDTTSPTPVKKSKSPKSQSPPKKPRAPKKNEQPRGCEHCELNDVPGINKIMGRIRGRKIALFAQSPGPEENDRGKELLGPSGQLLWRACGTAGLSRTDFDIQNAVRCFPATLVGGSYRKYLKMRNPTAHEIHCCSIHTDKAVKQLSAKHILLLGQVAAKAFLKTRSLPARKIFWSEEHQAKIYLADHPSFFLRRGVTATTPRGKDQRYDAFVDLLTLLASDLNKSATSLSDRFAFIKKQDYRLVTTKQQAAQALRIIHKYVAKGERISVDIEDAPATSIGWFGTKPLSTPNGTRVERVITTCGFCPRPGLSFVFVFSHKDVSKNDGLDVYEVAKGILEDSKVKKVFQYGCSDVLKFKEAGVEVRGFRRGGHDTMFSSYLVDPDAKAYGLEALTNRYSEFVGYAQIVTADLVAANPQIPDNIKNAATDKQFTYLWTKGLFDVSKFSLETMRLYNGADCDVTKRIEKSNRSKVNQPLLELYIDLSFVLYEMEKHGPLFDYRQHEKLELIYPHRVRQLLRKLRRRLGNKKFNPNSPDQVLTALYDSEDGLGLTFPYEGKPNTTKTTLMLLSRQDEFPKDVVDYRAAKKADSTYINGYKTCADRNHGRLRTKWWACLPAGELVLTSRGYVPVEAVRLGDSVISHTGRARKVVKLIDNGVHPIAEVTLQNGLILRTTYNHGYRVGKTWVEASTLKPGMVVTTYGDPERWKRITVPGYSMYAISTWGRVYSYTRHKLLATFKLKYGYSKVNLFNGSNPRGKSFIVHRLVARAFLPKPKTSKLELRHLDGHGWNSTLQNLAWGTSKQNTADSSAHGSTKRHAKITSTTIKYIRAQISKRGLDFKLAAELGISRESIRDIRKFRYHTIEITGKRTKFKKSPVSSIKFQQPEQTYGLTVEYDESHVTAGIVTHNTGTRTGRLSSGGKKQDPGVVNLQNIHGDHQLQNMCVADRRWRKFYKAAKRILKTSGIWDDLVPIWKLEKADQWKDAKAARDAIKNRLDWAGQKMVRWVRKYLPTLKTYLINDYGQIEVRVFAQMSGDKNLKRDCMSSDIHTKVGVAMTGWKAEMIAHDKKTRTLTKNVHFGILFGNSAMGTYKFVLARDPNYSGTQHDVEQAYTRYFEEYPGARVFIDSQRIFAEENSFVETMFGMKQPLVITGKEEDSYNDGGDDGANKRGSYWGNQAINGPVQGTAHQLLTCGLVHLKRKPQNYQKLGTPVMDVHDAFYTVCKVLDLKEAYNESKHLLEKAALETVKQDFPDVKWDVPIVTEAEAGLRLGCKVELTPGFTIGDFLLRWFEACRKQEAELARELKQVRSVPIGKAA